MLLYYQSLEVYNSDMIRYDALSVVHNYDSTAIRLRHDSTALRPPCDVDAISIWRSFISFYLLITEQWAGQTIYYTILYYIPHCVSKRGLQNMGYNAAARLPDKDSKCWRTATASAERLEQHWTRRLIGASIDQWRVRLKACVRSGGDILNTCCTFICIDLRTSR